MIKAIKDLLKYKELTAAFVSKNIKVRYQGSFFGFAWSMLDPLLMMVTFIFVFQVLLKSDIPNFPLFLLCGLFPWSFFSSSINNASGCIINNGNLINKVYFPRILLPLSVVIANTIHFIVAIMLLIFAVIFLKIKVGLLLLWLPLIIIIFTLFTFGLTLIFSCANVFFRDMPMIISFLLTLWFFITPIFYSLNNLTVSFRGFDVVNLLMVLNPLAAFISIFRSIILFNSPPEPSWILSAVISSFIMLVLGYVIFESCQKRFGEEV